MYDRTQQRLMEVAHQHAYPPFDSPCLTCHIVMRLDEDLDAVASDQLEIDAVRDLRWRRITEINRVLDTLDANCEARELHRYRTRDNALGRSTAETVCFELPDSFGQFTVGVICEFNTEYTAFSFRASPLADSSSRLNSTSLDHTKDAALALKEIMRGDVSDDTHADALIGNTFTVFWDKFFVWLANNGATSRTPSGDAARNRIFGDLGRRFAEFQGIVLRTPYRITTERDAPQNDDRFNACEDAYSDQIARAESAALPQQKYEGGPLIQMSANDIAAVRSGVIAFVNDRPNFFSRLLGFRNPSKRPGFHEGNSVLCCMFDGLAAYGSTLGSDTPGGVRYFVIYGGPSRHQLGRLVMMLHHCGETRLAALFDRDEIQSASTLIRSVDSQLNKSRRKTMSQINDLLTKIARNGRGGLDYRVARARYYRGALQQMLGELRVSRIDGWQTYDGFIRRNVLRRINNLVGIGARYEALQRRVRQIDYTDTTQHLARQQSHLVELQRMADIFGVGAFTYYVGMIAGYFLSASSVGVVIAENTICGLFSIDCDDYDVKKDAIKIVGFGIGFVAAISLRYLVPAIENSVNSLRQWLSREEHSIVTPRYVGILGLAHNWKRLAAQKRSIQN